MIYLIVCTIITRIKVNENDRDDFFKCVNSKIVSNNFIFDDLSILFSHMQPIPVFRLFIPDLKVSHEDEFDNLTAIFTETRLAVNIKVQYFLNYCLLHSENMQILVEFNLPIADCLLRIIEYKHYVHTVFSMKK